MIKTRLMGLLSHAKKYIAYTILWQWAALLSQVLAVFSIADLLERVVYRAVTVPSYLKKQSPDFLLAYAASLYHV